MALISKLSIVNGQTIQAEHVTRIIDALNESGSSSIIATGSFTGSFAGDGSQLTGITAPTASYALNSNLLDGNDSSVFATTSSNTFNGNQTINGDVIITGTASIAVLHVTYESASVIYSSGSNQLGDATNDIQTLIGTVVVSGSLNVTGSANIPSITGSLLGTSSFAVSASRAVSAASAVSASFAPNFSNTSLTFNNNRVHNTNNFSLEIKTLAPGNTPYDGYFVLQPSSSRWGINSFGYVQMVGGASPYMQLGTSNSAILFDPNDNLNFPITTNTGSIKIQTSKLKITGSVAISGSMGVTGSVNVTRLGIGAIGSTSIPLDIRAQGALITDVAFRVRNSGNTDNIISIAGDGTTIINGSVSAPAFTGSLFGTASWADNSITASYSNVSVSSSFATTASYALTASYVSTNPLKYYSEPSNTPVYGSPYIATTDQTGSIAIGDGAVASGSYAISIGSRAGVSPSHPDGGIRAINIGDQAGAQPGLQSFDRIAIGQGAGAKVEFGRYQILVGIEAGLSSSYSDYSVFIGERAGLSAVTASYSVGVGRQALYGNSKTNYAVAFGNAAGWGISNADFITAIGNQALYRATRSPNATALGTFAGYEATNATSSIYIGNRAGLSAHSSSYSVFIGYSTAFNRTNLGSNLIIVGPNASLPSGSNAAFNIGNVLYGTGIQTGSNNPVPNNSPTLNGKVGIGIILPTSGTLHVNGNIFATSFTGSLQGTASYASTASYVLNAASASIASTASYLNTLNQDLTINGNLTLNGTASIAYLNVVYETASVIYSSGSNQFGDAVNDTQTLIGTVITSGSLNVTGSLNAPSITGSLFGTASWSNNAITSSYYVETDPIFVAISGSLATTGSNTFVGNQNIQGLTRITGTTATDLVRITSTGTGAAFVVEDSTNPDATPFVIDASGNVGIGLTSSLALLHVKSGSSSATAKRGGVGTLVYSENIAGQNYLELAASTASNAGVLFSKGLATGNYGLVNYNNTDDSMAFLTAGVERMRISGSGNVGIGTTTPTAKLEVNGPAFPGIESIAKFTVSDDLASSLQIKNGTSAAATFVPEIIGTNSTNRPALSISGIATTDTGTESVTIFQSLLSSATAVVTRPIFQWKNFSTNIMTILADGNVGIGTLTPTLGLLQVNGNVYANSFTGSLFGTSSWSQNATNATYIKTTTNITAAQITGSLSAGGSVQVLGAPGAGNYYDWHAFVKFNSGSVAYNNGGGGIWYFEQSGTYLGDVFNLNAVTSSKTSKIVDGGGYGEPGWETGSIVIKVGAPLTLGNGTITVDMYSRELPR